jgi:deoxyhypusine synthase
MLTKQILIAMIIFLILVLSLLHFVCVEGRAKIETCTFVHFPFRPAFSDSSAGFGLVLHQYERPDSHVSIDSVKDSRKLTMVKIKADKTGLLMIGSGVPKNFVQDTVDCTEIPGKEAPMHKYAVQITVADVSACSSSTLKEANSWGKVVSSCEQMVYAEATTVLPLIYHAKRII